MSRYYREYPSSAVPLVGGKGLGAPAEPRSFSRNLDAPQSAYVVRWSAASKPAQSSPSVSRGSALSSWAMLSLNRDKEGKILNLPSLERLEELQLCTAPRPGRLTL